MRVKQTYTDDQKARAWADYFGTSLGDAIDITGTHGKALAVPEQLIQTYPKEWKPETRRELALFPF
ncbi:hypothetical protein [Paraburkholderia tropica]|uniref:hypothetical protein n=1 Tax=Paraburkholderia tropica TaxID=92647 RepID=UPI002AB2A01C|nr:hypothetical protein [Paraburkholderia tropica]